MFPNISRSAGVHHYL